METQSEILLKIIFSNIWNVAFQKFGTFRLKWVITLFSVKNSYDIFNVKGISHAFLIQHSEFPFEPPWSFPQLQQSAFQDVDYDVVYACGSW